MREKCARVLAAALMTGAIGFALAMPAIFETAQKPGRSLTAPPSFLQRSVHVVASAPSLSARDGRLEGTGTQPIQPASVLAADRSDSAGNGTTPASSRHSSRAGGAEPNPKPAPKPRPAPAPASPTRELADTTPPTAVSPPAPSQPAAGPGGKVKGKKSKHHHKSKGKPTEAPQPPVAATTPPPGNDSPVTEEEKDHGHDKDKDNGKGNDNGKGKTDDKGRDG